MAKLPAEAATAVLAILLALLLSGFSTTVTAQQPTPHTGQAQTVPLNLVCPGPLWAGIEPGERNPALINI